jgi:hypothetical protein
VDDQPTRASDPDGDPADAMEPAASQTVPADPYDTEIMPPLGPDATRPMPPIDSDATVEVAPDAAAITRPTETTAVQPAVPAGWKGQAAVRPTAPPVGSAPEWIEAEPSRAWWLPVVLAIVGLLLVVGIAVVLLMVLGNGNPSGTPSPSGAPTTPVTPSTASSTPSAPPTTPTTTAPSTGETVTAVIPSGAVGEKVSDLIAQLDALGLKHHESTQTDDSQPPGTVLSVVPGAGTTVPVATTTVEIVYAVPSESSGGQSSGPSTSSSG